MLIWIKGLKKEYESLSGVKNRMKKEGYHIVSSLGYSGGILSYDIENKEGLKGIIDMKDKGFYHRETDKGIIHYREVI